MENKKGFIQIYTGNGKGKTTSAVGLAVRARAYDLKVCYIYFHKEPDRWGHGEHTSLKKLGVDVFGFAKGHPLFDKDINSQKVKDECLEAINFIKKIYIENKYDVLILDEIIISIRDGFLKEEEVIDILNTKPEKLELILTGRSASKNIIHKADLVSEIENIKHPYDSGIQGRKGIDY
ncbi:cob(I)yrinic acid a,c-diamide adenosyltransferase [Candidatus Desantisbacteria bacterium]|nr:cob(I)yrinic acid a,c-diamide adenosyltransferase [Candidatus Desantisbacteria bacterium]